MNAASRSLEIPGVRTRVSPVTLEQYHQFPERNVHGHRTELIRGIVVEKMSKSPLHSSIASALYDLLRPQITGGFWLRKEEPLTLDDSEPEPDLSLVRGSRDQFTGHHPSTAALVVEIAISSAAEDRALGSLYAGVGVEEYWIVLPVERRVEVYRNPRDGTDLDHVVAEGDAVLHCSSHPVVEIRLRELFG